MVNHKLNHEPIPIESRNSGSRASCASSSIGRSTRIRSVRYRGWSAMCEDLANLMPG
jgi:hypothetical protein